MTSKALDNLLLDVAGTVALLRCVADDFDSSGCINRAVVMRSAASRLECDASLVRAEHERQRTEIHPAIHRALAGFMPAA